MGNAVTYSGDLSFDMKKPPTPFRQQTPGGLQYGKVVIIEGEVKTGITGLKDRFSVSLKANGKDVAFHYDVRFWKDDKAVVMNSRAKREWQNEERLINRFPKDEIFRLQIQITEAGFAVSDSNTNAPFTFPYRHDLSPEKVKKLAIKGNVLIKRVFYGTLLHFNQPALTEQEQRQQQRQRQPVYQSDPAFRQASHDDGVGLCHHCNQHQSGPRCCAIHPPVQCCNNRPLPYSNAQQQTLPFCHQPGIATLPPHQQQAENCQHQPSKSTTLNYHLPPPPYTFLQPSAPSFEDLSLENPLYTSHGSNGSERSAVSAPPTPPPRPLRRKQTANSAPNISAKRKRVPPPRPPRPPSISRKTTQSKESL
uniref:Galectin n=1 Tax=Plectus sambesii TaxID=2011161 RepID=A0A914UUM4_9BILA